MRERLDFVCFLMVARVGAKLNRKERDGVGRGMSRGPRALSHLGRNIFTVFNVGPLQSVERRSNGLVLGPVLARRRLPPVIGGYLARSSVICSFFLIDLTLKLVAEQRGKKINPVRTH